MSILISFQFVKLDRISVWNRNKFKSFSNICEARIFHIISKLVESEFLDDRFCVPNRKENLHEQSHLEWRTNSIHGVVEKAIKNLFLWCYFRLVKW